MKPPGEEALRSKLRLPGSSTRTFAQRIANSSYLPLTLSLTIRTKLTRSRHAFLYLA
jgi:hypothetical protein